MLRAMGLVLTFLNSWKNIGRFSDNFAPVNTLKRITRPFLQSISIIMLQITFGEFALFLTQLGRLAHCPPMQAHSLSSLFLRPQRVVWHVGHRAHLLISLCLSSKIREKIGSTRDSVRAGHFMSLLSHDLQSTIILNQRCFQRKTNRRTP